MHVCGLVGVCVRRRGDMGRRARVLYWWVRVRKGEGVCHEGHGCRCSRLCMCARRAGWGVTEKDNSKKGTPGRGCE